MSESERVARLRDQEARSDALPPSIEAMLGPDGALESVDAGRREWIATRRQLASAPSFPSAERLFHLTVLLEPHLEELARRAVLETAMEMLEDERHRHVLRCIMATAAARSGDVSAAQEWLAAVNSRSLDLAMDSAYRLAAGTVAVVRGEYAKVLGLLGRQDGDVPLFDRDALVGALLRAHALESTGDENEAGRILDALIELHGAERVDDAIRRHRPLHLCERARLLARRIEQRRKVIDLENASPARGGWRWLKSLPWVLALTALPFLVAAKLGEDLPIAELLHVSKSAAAFMCGGVMLVVEAALAGIILHGMAISRREKRAALARARRELAELDERIVSSGRGAR